MNPSYNNSFGQQGTISSVAGDIVLTPDVPGSRKSLRLGLVILFVIIAVVATCLAVYLIVFKPSDEFKTNYKNYVDWYAGLSSIYSKTVNVNIEHVDWVELSNDYHENGWQYDSVVGVGTEIGGLNPLLLNNGAVGRAKTAVQKTNQIAESMSTNLRVLNDLYNGYIGFWLPFIDDENYDGRLPGFDYAVRDWQDDATFEDELSEFGVAVEVYKNVANTLRYDFGMAECDDSDSDECAEIGEKMQKNRSTLLTEWANFKKDVFGRLSVVDNFTDNDLYGVTTLSDIQKEL